MEVQSINNIQGNSTMDGYAQAVLLLLQGNYETSAEKLHYLSLRGADCLKRVFVHKELLDALRNLETNEEETTTKEQLLRMLAA